MYFKTEMRSSAQKKLTWLLLLFRLPATHKTERVALWRKLKKSGAIQIKTSTYLLPDEPARYEYFQWLTQQIRDAGGDATLVRAREIDVMSLPAAQPVARAVFRSGPVDHDLVISGF